MSEEFKPDWMMALIQRAAKTDSFLQDNPKLVNFLLLSLPECKLLMTEFNETEERNINLHFIAQGSKPLKTSVTIYGDEADLNIDIMMDDSIGMIEIWFKEPQVRH